MILIAWVGSAHAGKAKIAVLGLEVAGSADTQATDAAKEITKQLRNRVNAGTSNYTMCGGCDKTLVEVKASAGCGNEAPSCMKTIANNLGANVLLYGRIERDGSNYKVALKLFVADGATIARTSVDVIPAASITGADGAKLARKMFAAVTGEVAKVSLTLHITNSERGRVLVDGREAGTYTDGTLRIEVDEGKVKLVVIPAETDRTRFEDSITVSADQSYTVHIATTSH
jgi:hypothetical protein